MILRSSWLRVRGVSLCGALGALPWVAHAEPVSNAGAVKPPQARVAAGDDEPAAEAEGAAPEVQRWWLMLGSGYMAGLGSSSRSGGDTASFVELAVSPEYQLTPDIALGPRLSYALGLDRAPSSEIDTSSAADVEPSFDQHLWQLGVAGRYQPRPRRGFYLGVGAALADLGASSGYISDSQWGLSLQLAAGVDLNVNRHLALGIELRAVHAEFPDTSQTSLGSDHDGAIPRYGSTTWLELGITGNIPL
jgi:opacity protein-like surface antigen